MKNLFVYFLFFISLFSQKGLAQSKGKTSDITMYVILDNEEGSAMNKMVKHAVDNFWTGTKFKYITFSEYEKLYKRKVGNYFLGFVTQEYEAVGNINVTISQICCFAPTIDETGDYVKKGEVYDKNILQEPMGFRSSYKETGKGSGKVKKEVTHTITQSDVIFVVQWYSNYFKPAYSGDYYSVGFHSTSGNKTANSVIHKKTLVLTKSDAELCKIDEDKAKKQYDYEIKFVTDEELNDYIEKKDPNIVYLKMQSYHEANGKKIDYGTSDYLYYYIVDVATGFSFYYSDGAEIMFIRGYFFRTLNK